MYRLATKQTGKKRVEKKRERDFFLRQTIRRAVVVLRSVIHRLCELWSAMLEWIEFRCVHVGAHSYPIQSDLFNAVMPT